MRIQQEIVLGIGGVTVLRELGINPTVYHMNEGHSSFLVLELIRLIMEEKKVSFNIAKDIVTARTVFTTHTPVPAGNDIFPTTLVETYFKDFWVPLGISKEEFLELGMKPKEENKTTFNMGILALKIAGKKNGVSKLHGAVSRELFGEVWPEITPNESPITYVTNGIHTCTWLAPTLKQLYNKYLTPYWQDEIHKESTWEKINKIPDAELWEEHNLRKKRLLKLVAENVTNRLRNNGMNYDQIKEITSKLNPNALTIGFARRFATYKRATLIFKDLERITQILNDESRPVQLIFAGKAHPRDVEGQNLIKRIHEISMMPQFKGKIFLLEGYNMEVSRHLISGVDVWLNNPRRPMEASGTSGEKASVNGVVNFSILDGWWAEGYNQKNGWAIGTNAEYYSYEEQDRADSESIYNILENKINSLNEDDLSVIRAGYRIPYLLDAARKVESGEIDFDKIRAMSEDEARHELMKIKGVGKKVADCTLLFSLGFKDCYPVDRHIARADSLLYPDGLPAFFSGNKGLAQQYIFHYQRTYEK